MALRCESSVTVAKSADEAFPWLLDADKVPQWMSGLEVYEPLDPGPLRVGSRIRQALVVSGHRLEFRMEVVRLDAPHAAELRFDGSGFRAANRYAVAEAPGGARVTWVIGGDTTSFKAKLIAPMVQSRLQEKLEVDLGRLQALLAGEAAAV